MTLELQWYLCLMLMTRLLYLRKDHAAGWQFVLALGTGQLVLMLVFFAINDAWVTSVLAIGVFSVAVGVLESRIGLVTVRLVSLLGLVLVPVLASLWLGSLQLNAAGDWLGQVGAGLLDRLAGGRELDHERFLTIALAMLLLANEVNIAMRGIFHACGLEPRTSTGAGQGSEETDVREFNAGRVIGILERWLMFLVVLFAGDWAALGFIIAAKGLVRLKKLEDPMFGEYMLVGTLLSALFAITVAWWVG